MPQPISRPLHGLITDYPYVVSVASAPAVVGFEDEAPVAAALCKVMSGTILASSVLTRAEWGVLPVISYKTHLVMDFAAGAFALAAPWVFGFSHNAKARDTFLAMGVAGLLASTLSRPEEMPRRGKQIPQRAARLAHAAQYAATSR